MKGFNIIKATIGGIVGIVIGVLIVAQVFVVGDAFGLTGTANTSYWNVQTNTWNVVKLMPILILALVGAAIMGSM